MYGVTLADNIIVVAGSVVTKSFLEKNIIIGGDPAGRITTRDQFAENSKKMLGILMRFREKKKSSSMQKERN